jgi:hypothetical protein
MMLMRLQLIGDPFSPCACGGAVTAGGTSWVARGRPGNQPVYWLDVSCDAAGQKVVAAAYYPQQV